MYQTEGSYDTTKYVLNNKDYCNLLQRRVKDVFGIDLSKTQLELLVNEHHNNNLHALEGVTLQMYKYINTDVNIRTKEELMLL